MKASHVSSEFWAIVGVGVSLALLIIGMGTFMVTDHSSMRAEMRSIRTDLGSEIGMLRADNRDDHIAIRNDLGSEISMLRSDNRDDHIAIRNDLGNEISMLRADNRDDHIAIRNDLGSEISMLRTDNRDDHIAIRDDIEALGGRMGYVEGRLGIPPVDVGPEAP